MVVLGVVFALLALAAFVIALWLVFKMADSAYDSFLMASLYFLSAIVSWMCIPVFLMLAQLSINH